MRIVADCHEPAAIFDLLRAAEGRDGSAVEIEAGTLDAGDYLIGPGAAVERKTGADFVASLLDGRLAEQAAKLRATYDKVVWIIEGDPYDGHVVLEPRTITGAISHLAVIDGATVLRTRSLEETADLLLSMAKRLQDGRRDLPLRPGKPADPRLLADYIVSGLPGIGRAKAQALLRQFGSVRGVFTANKADIAAIRGFGRKTAEAIQAALDTPYASAATDEGDAMSKDDAVERDQRAMQPGVGGIDRPKPDEGALEPLGDVSVEDGQRELQPNVDRPKPDAGDATL